MRHQFGSVDRHRYFVTFAVDLHSTVLLIYAMGKNWEQRKRKTNYSPWNLHHLIYYELMWAQIFFGVFLFFKHWIQHNCMKWPWLIDLYSILYKRKMDASQISIACGPREWNDWERNTERAKLFAQRRESTTTIERERESKKNTQKLCCWIYCVFRCSMEISYLACWSIIIAIVAEYTTAACNQRAKANNNWMNAWKERERTSV